MVLVLGQVGDVVIPCYTPECMKHDCIFCQSPKTNLCPTIRGTQVSQGSNRSKFVPSLNTEVV